MSKVILVGTILTRQLAVKQYTHNIIMDSVYEGRGGSASHFETTSEFQCAFCVRKTLAGMPEFHSVHQECWLKRITEEDRGIKQGTFWLDSALWPENGVLSVINYQHHYRFGRIHDIYILHLWWAILCLPVPHFSYSWVVVYILNHTTA